MNESSEVIGQFNRVHPALRREQVASLFSRLQGGIQPVENAIAHALLPSEIEVFSGLIHVLESEAFQKLITDGKITVAMVRPGVHKSKLGGTDGTASEQIIQEIKARQNVVFGYSWIFTQAMCEYFYKGPPHDIQTTMSPIRDNKRNRWEEFVDIMTSGPTTILILYAEDGNAIGRWREQIGARDVNQSDPETTIRGKFGSPDNYNNLVHGSDSVEAVRREISFIRYQLSKIVTIGQENVPQ